MSNSLACFLRESVLFSFYFPKSMYSKWLLSKESFFFLEIVRVNRPKSLINWLWTIHFAIVTDVEFLYSKKAFSQQGRNTFLISQLPVAASPRGSWNTGALNPDNLNIAQIPIHYLPEQAKKGIPGVTDRYRYDMLSWEKHFVEVMEIIRIIVTDVTK